MDELSTKVAKAEQLSPYDLHDLFQHTNDAD